MGEWEEKLPPIVREKLAKVGEATPEEKERIKDSEKLDSLLATFYKGQLSSEELWTRLKEYKDQGKETLLREAQLKLIDSVSPGIALAELQRRKEGILAIETLKEVPNTSVLELSLNSIEELQRSYRDEMQQVYNNIKAQVERNPQLRMEQVKQGQTTVIRQLSVDEAVKRNPQWQDFLSQHEKRYGQEFTRLIDRLKMAVS
jgi:hypothetical protein